MNRLAMIAVVALWLSPSVSMAQSDDASRDRAIFGGGGDKKTRAKKQPTSKPTSQPTSQPGGSDREQSIFGDGDGDASGKGNADGKEKKDELASRLSEKLGAGDRLQLGGLLYARFNLSTTTGKRVDDQRFSMPNLVDVYLDARPNDRVRAMVRGRVYYDPTVDENDPLQKLAGSKQVRATLNELWLKFDIARTLFVTIGQQRVLWGTTRLWNPVDFVNLTQRPILSPFDGRDGVPMVKLHLPIESLGWNFYAIGLLDGVNTLDKAGVVGRGEFVFSTIELGLSGAYRKGLDPRLGVDISAGIWDLDFTGEFALAFDDQASGDVALMASAGLQYSIAVFDDDMLIIGGEYFFNKEGTDDFNPLELFDGKRQYFYVGKHYAGLMAVLPRPSTLDDWSFTLSGIGNLSDLTFISRLDVSYRFLTYITVQLFASLHFGKTGELRIGDSAFPAAVRPLARTTYTGDPNRRIPTQVLDLGLWLRVDL